MITDELRRNRCLFNTGQKPRFGGNDFLSLCAQYLFLKTPLALALVTRTDTRAEYTQPKYGKIGWTLEKYICVRG